MCVMRDQNLLLSDRVSSDELEDDSVETSDPARTTIDAFNSQPRQFNDDDDISPLSPLASRPVTPRNITPTSSPDLGSPATASPPPRSPESFHSAERSPVRERESTRKRDAVSKDAVFPDRGEASGGARGGETRFEDVAFEEDDEYIRDGDESPRPHRQRKSMPRLPSEADFFSKHTPPPPRPPPPKYHSAPPTPAVPTGATSKRKYEKRQPEATERRTRQGLAERGETLPPADPKYPFAPPQKPEGTKPAKTKKSFKDKLTNLGSPKVSKK